MKSPALPFCVQSREMVITSMKSTFFYFLSFRL